MTSTKPRRGGLLLGVVAIVVAAIAVVLVMRSHRATPSAPTAPTHTRSELAVLPFQNLSAVGPHAYFAGGLHDELLTQLAKVAALKVISRTSVMGYATTTKPLKQIADELGVGSIVEGSVQVAGNRLRVNVQLIDAATDEHLWAERYDRTLDDAFAIQSDVAQQIVKAVGAALGSQEQRAITEAPTASPEAYRLYLQGQEYAARRGNLQENLEYAQKFCERALALDPDFALAHAALSWIHGQSYWFGHDPSSARAARMRHEAEIALNLAPGLPEAHVAMGFAHYWGRRDYRRALGEFRLALRERPGYAEAWHAIGLVERRLGDWTAADAAFQRSVRLNPRDPVGFYDLGYLNSFAHHYREAIEAYDRALALAPDLSEAAVQRGYAYLLWTGDLGPLQAATGGLAAMVFMGNEGPAIATSAYVFLLKREPDSLLAALSAVPPNEFHVYPGFQPLLYAAWAHRMRGDLRSARGAFQQAVEVLDTVRVSGPDAWTLYGVRGMALAGLGRTREALTEAQRLKQSLVYREDAIDGPDVAEKRAMVLAQAGAAAAALDEITRLLAAPSCLSAHKLRLDPRWDPLREDPRFKALLVKYGAERAR